MCALGDTTQCVDPHFSLSDEELDRMRKAVRKLGPKRSARSFGTYYTHRWGDPADIRDWYYWHRRDVESMERLGVIEGGR